MIKSRVLEAKHCFLKQFRLHCFIVSSWNWIIYAFDYRNLEIEIASAEICTLFIVVWLQNNLLSMP